MYSHAMEGKILTCCLYACHRKEGYYCLGDLLCLEGRKVAQPAFSLIHVPPQYHTCAKWKNKKSCLLQVIYYCQSQ